MLAGADFKGGPANDMKTFPRARFLPALLCYTEMRLQSVLHCTLYRSLFARKSTSPLRKEFCWVHVQSNCCKTADCTHHHAPAAILRQLTHLTIRKGCGQACSCGCDPHHRHKNLPRTESGPSGGVS